MRHLLIAAVLLLPATARSQFPPPGTYQGGARQAGSSGEPGSMMLSVALEGDSTVVKVYQDPKQPYPLSEQGLLDQSWTIVLGVIPGGLHCRFVTLSTKWEAYCEDQFGQPQYEIWFDRTPIAEEEAP